MDCNSRRQICLAIISDIAILIVIGMYHRRIQTKKKREYA